MPSKQSGGLEGEVWKISFIQAMVIPKDNSIGFIILLLQPELMSPAPLDSTLGSILNFIIYTFLSRFPAIHLAVWFSPNAK